jgi:hypothetical protein
MIMISTHAEADYVELIEHGEAINGPGCECRRGRQTW